MGESGPEAETPVTVNQMFTNAVKLYGKYTALGWKEGEQWKTMNYSEYYKACRTTAKSFLKVRAGENVSICDLWLCQFSLFNLH